MSMLESVEEASNRAREDDHSALLEARSFFALELPVVKREFFDKASLAQIFEVYRDYINNPAGLAEFKQITQLQLQESPEDERRVASIEQAGEQAIEADPYWAGLYRKYLLGKLPRPLLEEKARKAVAEKVSGMPEEELMPAIRGTIDEYRIKDLPRDMKKELLVKANLGRALADPKLIEAARIEITDTISINELKQMLSLRKDRMILGFHTASKEYEDYVPASKLPATLVSGGKSFETEEGKSYVHHNLNYRKLYGGGHAGGHPKYLYLVETSSSALNSSLNGDYYRMSGEKKWLLSPQPLPIRGKLELTPGVIEELGLGFD